MTSSDSSLQVGQTSDGEDFALPRRIAVQASAVMGKRGTGKTVTASVIVEELLEAAVHVVVIDPVDVWFGLKSSADGDEEGFPILTLGGSHGDLPLEAEHGARLADFAVEERVPMILSLRHLRKGQQRRFVVDFAEQLYHRKGEPEHRVPLHLVVDEASRFIPQQTRGNTARSVGAFEDIVRQGRADGFGVQLIDQRPATVNKNVLSQVDTLVVHQVTSPHDRKALDDWINQHDLEGHRDRFLEKLASLDLGEAWFWNPGLDVFELVQVRMRHTFDSSSTPDLGEEAVVPEKIARVNLDELRETLEEKLGEEELRTSEELKARVEELEDEVEEARDRVPEGYVPAGTTDIPDDYVSRDSMLSQIDAAVAEARRESEAAFEAHVETLEERLAEIGHRGERIQDAAADIVEISDRDGRPELEERPRGGSAVVRRDERAPESSPSPTKPTRRGRPDGSSGDLSTTQQKILRALAEFEAVGLEVVDKAALAGWVGLSPTSGGYAGHLADLRAEGLLTYPKSGHVQLTDAGRRRAGSVDEPATLEELHRRWLSNLSGTRVEILEALIDFHPSRISKEDLAKHVGLSPTSGGYAKHLADMRKYGVIEYPQPGWVRAGDILYPEELT